MRIFKLPPKTPIHATNSGRLQSPMKALFTVLFLLMGRVPMIWCDVARRSAALQTQMGTFSQIHPTLQLRAVTAPSSLAVSSSSLASICGRNDLQGNWKAAFSRCLFVPPNLTATWSEAEKVCKDYGGNLASIPNVEENQIVYELYVSSGARDNHGSMWIGFSDNSQAVAGAEEGKWKWVDGTSSNYTNWTAGQPNDYKGKPNNGMGQDCAAMWRGGNPGEWSDLGCGDHVKPFVCAADFAMSRVDRNSSTTHFFVPAASARTWADAEAHCYSHGGHLASIVSSEDNEIVQELFVSSGARQAYGGMWIGTSDDESLIEGASEGSWEWSDGSHFNFSRWNNGTRSRTLCTLALASADAELIEECFVLHQEALSYADARARCNETGGHIATVRSQAEDEWLQSLGGFSFWIGLTEAEDSPYRPDSGSPSRWGTWIHPDGTEASYFNWGKREPNNAGGNEACVEMSGGTWNDLACTALRSFICAKTSVPTNRCGAVSASETWSEAECDEIKPFVCAAPVANAIRRVDRNSSTTHFFVPAASARTWADAEAHCYSHGGHLASIVSSEDNEIVQELFVSSGARQAYGGMWIGTSDDGSLIEGASEGSWEWSDGSHFNFSRWNEGNPSASECTTSLALHHGEECFVLHQEALSYADAKARCAETGGQIATVSSLYDHNYLSKLREGVGPVWIGLREAANSDRPSDAHAVSGRLGRWIHPDGTEVSYFNWASGEPNNAGGNEACVEMSGGWNAQQSSGWNDAACNERRPFFCAGPSSRAKLRNCAEMRHGAAWSEAECDEIKPFVCAAPVANAIRRVDRNSSTSHFFVPAASARTWADAEAHCYSHGGHLASIVSSEDNEIVQELFVSSGARQAYGGMWIGTSDDGSLIEGASEGSWEWSDGSSACFQGWEGDAPVNAGRDCGAVTLDVALWTDARCDEMKPFVCAVRIEEERLRYALQSASRLLSEQQAELEHIRAQLKTLGA